MPPRPFHRLIALAMLALAASLPACQDRHAAAPPKSASQPAAATPATPVSTSPPPAQEPPAVKLEIATFGAGCFWGVEHIFRHQVPGVVEAVSGYAGGKLDNPTYRQICDGDTGHAEVVQVTFDPAKTSYEKITDAFFRLHDPTQVNRQGPDIGDQYRSVIFYHNDDQKAIAEKVKAERQKKHAKPIATRIEPASKFYKAEDYHQRYYDRTGKEPYCHVLRSE